MHISDKFLEILKENPKEMVREVHQTTTYYQDYIYYIIIMKWVSGPSTIEIEFHDYTSITDNRKSLTLRNIKVSKKKYYGFYTARTEIDMSNLDSDVRKNIANTAVIHYNDLNEDDWKTVSVVGPTVDDYL